MDTADSLATTEDFVGSEAEKELTVNGCAFPRPEGGAVVSEGQPFDKKVRSSTFYCL